MRFSSLLLVGLVASVACGQSLPPQVKDTPYAPSWDGVKFYAPSMNAVYDEIESIVAGALTTILANIDAQDPNGGVMLCWPASAACEEVLTTAYGRGLLAEPNALEFAAAVQQNADLDVRWKGADGTDPNTDDAAAIQMAIEDANDAGGGVVRIPAGDYTLNSGLTMRPYVYLVGSGRYNTRLLVNADVNGITIPDGTGWGGIKDLYIGCHPDHGSVDGEGIRVGASVRNYTFERVTVWGGATAPAVVFRRGLWQSSSSGMFMCRLKDCYFRNAAVAACDIYELLESTVDNCTFGTYGSTLAAFRVGGATTTIITPIITGYGVGLKCYGSGISIVSPHVEMDNAGFDPNTQAIWIVGDSGAADWNQYGRDVRIVGGSVSVQDVTGDDAAYIRLSGNSAYARVEGVNFAHATEANMVRIEDTSTGHAFAGGNVVWQDVIVQDSVSANLYDCETVVTDRQEYRYAYGEFADLDWHLGSLSSGVHLGTGVSAAELADANHATPGLYVTTSGGTPPFNLAGNAIVKSRTSAGNTFSVFTDSPSAERARYSATYAQFFQDVNIPDGHNYRINGVAVGSGTGDITDVWTDAGGDVSALTAGAGDTFDATNADSSVPVTVGANETVDAVGEMTYDTTDKVLVVYDGTSAKVLAAPTEHVTATIADDGAWDAEAVPIWQAPTDMAVTITEIRATCMGSTPVLTYNLEERAWASLGSAGTDVYAADQTADGDGESETAFSNASIAAGAHLVFTTGASSESGTVDLITLTIYYQRERE